MGQTCGGCCTQDTVADEFNMSKPSVGERIGLPKDDLFRLVRIQALARGFITRRKYLACRRNPTRFEELFPQVRRKHAGND